MRIISRAISTLKNAQTSIPFRKREGLLFARQVCVFMDTPGGRIAFLLLDTGRSQNSQLVWSLSSQTVTSEINDRAPLGESSRMLRFDLGKAEKLAMETLRVKTARRTQLVDVTGLVERAVKASGVASGVCYVYVPHTTAGVTINEHADPDVATDLEGVFDRLVPHSGPYRHSEGNSDSHAKATLVGSSQIIFVEEGRLALGRWQGVFLCEFDGPRERRVYVKVVKD